MKRNEIQVGVDYAVGSTRPSSYGRQWTADPHASRRTLVDDGRWSSRDHWDKARLVRAANASKTEVPTETLADGTTIEALRFRRTPSRGRAEGVLMRNPATGDVSLVPLAQVVGEWATHAATVAREAAEARRDMQATADREQALAARWASLAARLEAQGVKVPGRWEKHSSVTMGFDALDALLTAAERGKEG